MLLGVMFLPSTGSSATPDAHPIGEYLLLLPLDLMTFSLIVVAAVGYNAIVGERVTSTVRFVLGLPATRRDLVLGKFLSRVGVVAIALAMILVIANVLVFRGYGSPHLLPFWVMGGWMLVYVVVWSAVTIGYSAAFNSPYRTLSALVVTYVIFSPDFGVWSVIIRPLFSLLFTGSFVVPSYETLALAPLWLRITERLNPLVDFWLAMRWSIEFAGPGTPTGGALPHLLGTLVFLSFGILPFVFGLRRFERTDIDDEQSGFQLGDWLWRLFRRIRVPVKESESTLTSRNQPSRIRLIAITDMRHTLQSWVIVGAFVATLLLTGPDLWQGTNQDGISTVREELGRIATTFSLPVLVLGIAVGHNAVVGERATGTVRLLLGTPTTRRDIVLGKLCSRVGVVIVILFPVLLFAEALVVVRLGGFYPGAIFAWAGWTLLFAVIWTGVVVGISAAVSSRYRSLAVIFATYLLFSRDIGLWDPVVRPAIAFVFTGRFSAQEFVYNVNAPVWFRLLDNLNPFVALATFREGLFEVTEYGTQHTQLIVPVFLYSAGILVLFAVVSLTVGTRRFNQCNLG